MTSTPRDRFEEIHELATASFRGDFSAQQRQRLEQLVCDDAQARRLYVQYQFESLSLRNSAPMDAPETVPTQIAAVSAGGGWRRTPQINWRRHPIYFFSTVAALWLGLWLAFGAAVLPWRSTLPVADRPASAAPSKRTVARITGAAGARWNDSQGPTYVGAFLRPGQQIDLAAGLAEFQYDSGATVILEGPARYVVLGEMSGNLRHGKLTVRVTKKTARGFAIEAPAARLVDLGTEFGVQVLLGGLTEIAVFDGEVRADLTSGMPSRTLTAGMRLWIDAAGRLDGESSQAPAVFAREVPSSATDAAPPGLVSIDFDAIGAPTQTGEPDNRDGLSLPGQVGGWHSLSIGVDDVMQAKKAKLMAVAGPLVFEFNPQGSATYRACSFSTDALRRDVLFLSRVNTRVTSPEISWSLTGLTPGARFDLILFGQLEPRGPTNPADFSIAGHDAGNGVGAPVALDSENDGNFYGVMADAQGAIHGSFALREGQAYSSWSGLQCRLQVAADTQ